MKDIILVLSDQHAGVAGCFDRDWMDTPAMETLAAVGSYFPHAYCNAPLCVPSRMSFLSGLYPSETGIYNNDSTLSGDLPTLAHALGAAGYRTVLSGRMHFKGEEQHHGFSLRLVGDITSQYWGTGGERRTDMGDYLGTAAMKGCRRVIGAGYSPVMAYDDMVLEASLNYLATPHPEPLFMVIGLYSPHFPYVAEQALYDKYKVRVPLINPEPPPRPCYSHMVQRETPERRQRIEAAYAGMVERLDGQIGEIYQAFLDFSANRESIFVYTSDHGDQCGKRGIFGKQTLYEDAVRVPLLVAGNGISHRTISNTVSLLDLGATLLELGGAEMPHCGGHSFLPLLKGEAYDTQPVRIQHMLEGNGGPHLLQAAAQYPYKLVREEGSTYLFNLANDPDETTNLSHSLPEVVDTMLHSLLSAEEALRCEADCRGQMERQMILKAWGKACRPGEPATITIPPEARRGPAE